MKKSSIEAVHDVSEHSSNRNCANLASDDVSAIAYAAHINGLSGTGMEDVTLTYRVEVPLVRQCLRLGAIAALCLSLSANALGNELSDRLTTQWNAANFLKAKKFSELDAMITEARNAKTRTESGIWRLTLFYAGMADALPVAPPQQGWREAQDTIEKWIEAYPKSPAGPIAYGNLLIGRAFFQLSGGGIPGTVEPQNKRAFLSSIEQARVFLETYKAVASADPHWYRSMGEIAAIQRWPEDRFNALLAEALQKEPQYYETYFAAVDYYGPKWGGNAQALEKFARRAVEETKPTEGYGMYARIYWYAAQTQYGDSLFRQSNIDWDMMKKSMRDVVAKYPDEWNINNFARFACLEHDKELTAELIMKVEADGPLPEVWHGDDYDQCRTWAFDGVYKT